MRRRRSLGWATLIAGALLLWSVAATAQDTIRIGSFLAVTGRSSFLGAPALATLRQFAEEINKAGGVTGRKIEILYYDTGIDAKAAQTAARRLIEVDKVDLIIGGSTASASLAVIPIVEDAGIPFISLAGANAIVEPVRKWVFKTGVSDRLACARIFADMRRRNFQRISVIAESEGHGLSMSTQCADLAPRAGITIISTETYRAGSRRVEQQLSRIDKTGGVQAVLVAGFGSGPIYLTQSYRDAKIELPLYHSHGVSAADLIERLGRAADGVRMPVAMLDIADRLPRTDPFRKTIDNYRLPFQRRWEVPATVFGGYAYDALQLALGAVHRARGTDPAKVRRELERTRGYRGVTGIYQMSRDNHGGLGLDAFRMVEVLGGDIVIVD